MSIQSTIAYPFPGLKAYGYSESIYFAGRDRQKYQLLKKINENNFTAVVGNNGVGKTSLINSEIIPELTAGFVSQGRKDWKIIDFRPGKNPIGALSTAFSRVEVIQNSGEKIDSNLGDKFESILRNGKHGIIEILEKYKLTKSYNILLFIDHLDDLIFYSDNESKDEVIHDVGLFIDRIVEINNQTAYPVTIVTTLRTEMAGHFSKFPQLAEVINKNQFLLGTLDRKDLLPIFKKIAATGSVSFEPSLLEHINDYYKSNPLVLGEFQHAMKRCVDLWVTEGGTGDVTLSQLEAVGGLSESIGDQLDDIYGYLKKDKKEASRLIFQAMTGTTSTGTSFVIPRSIQSISEITDKTPEDIIEVLKLFTSKDCGVVKVYDAQDITGRLEHLDHILDDSDNQISVYSTITIAQDLILEEWVRLDKWIKEEHLNANIYADLAKDVAKKEPLYEGEKLKATWKWYEENQPHIGWANRYSHGFEEVEAFLLKSKSRSDKELDLRAAEEKSRERKSKRNRNVKVIFSVVAILLFLYATNQARKAKKEQDVAAAAMKDAAAATKQAAEDSAKAAIAKKGADLARIDADLERQNAAVAKAQASSDSIKAAGAIKTALEEQDKAKKLQIESNRLSQDVAEKKELLDSAEKKVERSKIAGEYLSILEAVRKKAEDADKILRRSNNEQQQKEAAELAASGYKEFQKTKEVRFQGLQDSISDQTKRKLFSSMKLAFQKVGSSHNLDKITNGIAVGKNYKVANENGNGEFIIGTNDDKSTVFKVVIDEGRVVDVDEFSDGYNPIEKTKGIKDINYSNSANHFLVSHLPTDQINRFVSSFDMNGKFVNKQKMPSLIERSFPVGDNDFIVVDQKSNVHFLSSIDDSEDPYKMTTIHEAADTDSYRAMDYDKTTNKLFLVKNDKRIIVFDFNDDTELTQISSLNPQEFDTEITAIKFIPNKKWIVIGNLEGELFIYDLDSQTCIYKSLNEHAGNINCFELSDDGRILLSGGRDKIINIWEVDDLATYMPGKVNFNKEYSPTEFDEVESIRAISFVDNNWIIVVSSTEGFSSNKGGVSLLTLDFDIMGEKLVKLVN